MAALAAQVRRLRDARGWSAQRLADELAAVGLPLDRSVIANLENGRRASVDVQELLAMALALEVTPLDLLVPPEASDDDLYAVTPERTEPVGRVRAWIAGGFLVEPATAADLAKVIATMPEGRGQRLASEWLGDAQHNGLAGFVRRARAEGRHAAEEERNLRGIRQEMRRRGVPLPALPPGLEDFDAETGDR